MGVDIGGLVASGVVSAVVAMVFKYFDRPHSRLVATGLNMVVPVGHERDWDEAGTPVSITNFGTGSAYNLHFAGSDCIVSTVRPAAHPMDLPRDESYRESLEPGKSFILRIHGWKGEDDGNPVIVLTHDRFPSVPWLRWLRKTYRWPLATLQVEHGLSSRIYAPESIPVWRQLLGAIGKYELRARQEALRGERHLRPSSEQSKQ